MSRPEAHTLSPRDSTVVLTLSPSLCKRLCDGLRCQKEHVNGNGGHREERETSERDLTK